MGIAPLLALVAATAELLAAARHPLPSVAVECRLDRAARAVTGTVTLELVNPTAAPLERAHLWLYPNRLASVPAGLDDVSFYWVYPRRHDPGRMELTSVAVDAGGGLRALGPEALRAEVHAAAGEGVLWSVALPAPVPPGERLRLRARYTARIPERHGPLGCVDGTCTMAGGFYPMPAALDRAGWDLLGPPMRADMDVSVALDAPASIVLFDQWSGNGAAALRVRAPRVRYATLVVAPRHHVSERRVGGARIRHLGTRAPPPADDARRVLLAYTLEDHAASALDTAEAAFELLAALGRAGGGAPLRPAALTLVEAPLRFELAASHERVVLLSDRFHRIWPAERFRKFHRRQLARAVFSHWLVRRGRVRAGGPLDPDDAADLVASWLADQLELRRYQRRELLGQILRPVSFVPAIDQLLYAPQTMFAEAYFGDATGGDTLRDDPRRFAGVRPRGRLVYLKLRDLLGGEALGRAMLEVVRRGADLAEAAEAAGGEPLGWFFRQWSRPPAPVNYRLVAHRARPARGGGFDNVVVVARETAPGEVPPVEPVEVLAVDEDGAEHRLRWSGRGQVGALGYRSSAPVEWAWVDPDARLQETSVSDPGQHARFDNRDRHELRFVYNSFGVLLNVSDLSALLAADFTLSRVHDLRNQVRLVAFRSASVELGGQVSYRRGFGREVTPDRLLGRAALALSAARLDGDFFGDSGQDARGATQVSLTGSLGRDTEVFPFEPLAKHDLRLAATLHLTRRDAAAGAPADLLVSGEAGVWTSRTVTPWAGHTFAGELGLSAVVGDLESRTQLLAAGGAGGVRGLAPGAVFGRALATARGEVRTTFVHDLDWNLGHYTFVRGVGGVAFADVGLVSPCDGYLPRGRASVLASAGYGLQVWYDNFGTLPALLRVDAAVRLAGGGGQCLGTPAPDPPAVQLYVSFLPPF